MPEQQIKIDESQKDIISQHLAEYFFEYWQNHQGNPKKNNYQTASLKSGSRRGSPGRKVAV